MFTTGRRGEASIGARRDHLQQRREPWRDRRQAVRRLWRFDLGQARPVPGVPLHALALGGGGRGDGDAHARRPARLGDQPGRPERRPHLDRARSAVAGAGDGGTGRSPGPGSRRRARTGAAADGDDLQPADPRAGRRRTAAGGGPGTDSTPRTLRRRNAAAGQARVFDRARGKQLRGSLRGELPGPLPGPDPDRERGAAAQLLRGDEGRPRQPDRPAQWPGSDLGDGGGVPRARRRRAGHDLRHGPGRRGRLRLPGRDCDAARPAERERDELEGLRRRSGHPLCSRGRLARPSRLLPLADRRGRVRGERRQPRTARP